MNAICIDFFEVRLDASFSASAQVWHISCSFFRFSRKPLDYFLNLSIDFCEVLGNLNSDPILQTKIAYS